MFYTAGAARCTFSGRIGSQRRWCDSRGGRGYHGRGNGGGGRCGGITVAVSRHVLLVVLGRRVFGYVTLRYGYVGGGRAQGVWECGHAGETH